MARRYLILGGLSALLSIAFGAFGAHALEKSISESALETYHTGVEYQMYHALALILLSIIAATGHAKPALLKWAGNFYIAGTVLFSGSLYVISLSGISQFGMIAPIGGLSFMLGWLMLIIAAGSFAKKS